MPDETVNVRYMVDDVAAAIDFYTKHLGFTEQHEQPARLRRRAARAAPPAAQRPAELRRPADARRRQAGARRVEPDPPHLRPTSTTEIDRLRGEGVPFRNDVVTGPGGSQILLEDPVGQPGRALPAGGLTAAATAGRVTGERPDTHAGDGRRRLEPPSRLSRQLGTSDAVMIGLGSMIGAGVFAAIGPAAAAAGGGLLIGLALAAAVAYCNATSSAQLAARYPASGGTYVYGRRAPRPPVGLPRRVGVRHRQDRQLRGDGPHLRLLRRPRPGPPARRSAPSSPSPP